MKFLLLCFAAAALAVGCTDDAAYGGMVTMQYTHCNGLGCRAGVDNYNGCYHISYSQVCSLDGTCRNGIANYGVAKRALNQTRDVEFPDPPPCGAVFLVTGVDEAEIESPFTAPEQWELDPTAIEYFKVVAEKNPLPPLARHQFTKVNSAESNGPK